MVFPELRHAALKVKGRKENPCNQQEKRGV